VVLCGEVPLPDRYKNLAKSHIHRFHCNPEVKENRINIGLPHFIRQVNCHFPPRVKDLLEIAGYVYAADRMTKRGQPMQVEYHAWSRRFQFFIKVRDHKFWQDKTVIDSLSRLLTFTTGDISYDFTFLSGGYDVGQSCLFDDPDFKIDKNENSVISLFSGGLDSLAGALELLNTTNFNLVLVSHQSNNPRVTSIQNGIYNLLKKDYPGRVQRFPLECSLSGDRAVEESQRSRIFLYTSIAFSLMSLVDQKTIHVFENGMTSLNFPKRQDMMNARSSRTTHPQTLFLLENFFNTISDDRVKIKQPFLGITKTEVVQKINHYGGINYINSTISCTKTFNISKKKSQASHCGTCSQCIDRRFSIIAAGLEDYDAIYDIDIITDSIEDDEGYTHLCDYIATANSFSEMSAYQFPHKFLNELNEIISYLPGEKDTQIVQMIYELTQQHSNNVLLAVKKIRQHEEIFKPKIDRSIYSFLDDRTFLKPPVERLIEKIVEKIKTGIPIAFERAKPTHENVLNDHINALLVAGNFDYEREYPAIKFAFAKTIPDHSIKDFDLLIEAKLLKKNSSRAAFTDQISSDIIKYGKANKLFFIYDPDRKIVDEREFERAFKNQKNCYIVIFR
jgi:hypothetical protein